MSLVITKYHTITCCPRVTLGGSIEVEFDEAFRGGGLMRGAALKRLSGERGGEGGSRTRLTSSAKEYFAQKEGHSNPLHANVVA
jgi:hypothetical protein